MLLTVSPKATLNGRIGSCIGPTDVIMVGP